jgi:hypothetical protein
MRDFMMPFRYARKSTRVRVGALLVVVLLAAGVTFALGTSSATPSFFQECMRPFTQSERESGEQWLKEKIASQEKECRYLAYLNETITPSQEQEGLEKFRATHKPGELSTGSGGTRVTKIVDRPQPPPGVPFFQATSHWVGSIDGQWYTVWAGATAGPPTKGVVRDIESAVVVYQQPVNLDSTESGSPMRTYSPPGGDGEPLRITAASDGVLTLQTSTGETMSFDVATRTFG